MTMDAPYTAAVGAASALSDGFRLYQQPFPSGDYSFVQLAFIVDDVIATAQHWIDLYGVGPFYVMPRGSHSGIYNGAPIEVDTQIAVSQAGPLQIEFIQDFSTSENVYGEISRGPTGGHHLGTFTSHYDDAIAHYTAMGHPPRMVLRPDTDARVAYVDTTAEIGLFTEVIEYTDSFLKALRGTARRAASWDGSEPIRVLGGAS
jgi:hypothetical protein